MPDRYARSDARQPPLTHLAGPERPEQADRSRRASAMVTGSLYRISFIETNAYVPLDVPTSSSSPEHMPPLHRLHQHLHGEWYVSSILKDRVLFCFVTKRMTLTLTG